MSKPPVTAPDDPLGPPSIYDPDPDAGAEDEFWFLPPENEDSAPSAMPWPVAARAGSLEPGDWLKAEAAQYQNLVSAAEAVTAFGVRLSVFDTRLSERFALNAVSAVLRGEGVWLGPEQIALYRALRLVSGDHARDLARASWAVRRLTAGGPDPVEGVRAFLGRETVSDPHETPGREMPVGPELDAAGAEWISCIQGLEGAHPMTRAAYGFAHWRAQSLTPWDEMLEPSVAAMLLGGGRHCPFLPMGGGGTGHRLDRHALTAGEQAAETRLQNFYAAVEAGALSAMMELDRLSRWKRRAVAAIDDLSGRTPPALIQSLLRFPILSADLAAAELRCSEAAARRNLNLFGERGLVRELTGQDRYRFWTVAA